MLFNNVQLIGLAIALLALAILLFIHHRKSDGSLLETRDNILELEEMVYELEQKIKKFIMSDTYLWELSVDDLVEICVKKDTMPASHREVWTVDFEAIKDDLYLWEIIAKYDDNILVDIIDYKQFSTILNDIMEALKHEAGGESWFE